MDTETLECAVVVRAPDETAAEWLARKYASTEDMVDDDRVEYPESYKCLRVAEVTVVVK